ncbi:hypothetical protein PN36_22440 [Candidatus Thiomargarita nelsonii]|uniref:Transposase (putative) YhgA-like domain-containing protein n=1 Tax=Candidatus Thiomargarita nelsonii TaxID=1003181 RepID=A0A4E0QRK4_9GAMM|nr:hypothetical protein PN36_22440 [Candidatus Thiomargarita nelsonii]
MTKKTSEFDSPWKKIIEHFFKEFMLFFFSQVHDSIDWTRGYEFLDKELQKLIRESITKERRVDKLVKVWLKNGETAVLYIHIEVQAQYDSEFKERMFIYHYRLYDRYGPNVVSLAILGDDRKNWLPKAYSYEKLGCGMSFHFPIVKLLDYRDKWDELDQSNNPFAIVVKAHLKSLETRKSLKERYSWKVDLYKALYQANYNKDEIRELYAFLDWVLTLPSGLEQNFDNFVYKYEEAKKVEYVTSIERRGILQRSREDVIENLDVRFNHVPETVVKKIQSIHDTSLLTKLHREAILVESIEAFEKRLKKQGKH